MDSIDVIISEIRQNKSVPQSVEMLAQRLAAAFTACKTEPVRIFRLADRLRNCAADIGKAVTENAE